VSGRRTIFTCTFCGCDLKGTNPRYYQIGNALWTLCDADDKSVVQCSERARFDTLGEAAYRLNVAKQRWFGKVA